MVALEILDNYGINFLVRWGHVLVGIAWIGLLYYFNFVQVPAYAQMDGGTRNEALDKVTWRALWWFRWAAAATLLFGIMIGLIPQSSGGDGTFMIDDYFKSAAGVSIATGMLLGITMFLNVWIVIWPNQKKVIANARNVIAGGQPDPGAADAGRRALLASRVNAIFSLPMLAFMVGTSHFLAGGEFDTSSDRAIYWGVTAVIWAGLELNALGVIGGRGQNLSNWIFENHRRAIAAGLVLTALWYGIWEVVF